MHNMPQLIARLISSSESLPKHRLGAGTGTTHDFNIHIICGESGVHLPVGTYVFGYEAMCEAMGDDVATQSAPGI